MVEESDLKNVFRQNVQIDDEGLKSVRVVDIADLLKLGIADVSAFIQGLLDAENDKEFGETSEDYVKGYKYGKTGKF